MWCFVQCERLLDFWTEKPILTPPPRSTSFRLQIIMAQGKKKSSNLSLENIYSGANYERLSSFELRYAVSHIPGLSVWFLMEVWAHELAQELQCVPAWVPPCGCGGVRP